jgi:two-component system, response regulator PdtaR
MAAREPGVRKNRRPAILIVEDDALMATLVEEVVAGLGYEIAASVATGEGAIEAARASRPDLVLMDVNLRGHLNGIEAAEAIRAERPCLVVFMTAYGDPETTERMKRIAGSAVMGKPISVDILRLTLQQLLRDGREAR